LVIHFKKILTQLNCLLYFNNFGYTRHSSSKLGSALISIILAALGIAQASLALPSFAQNLHKICSRRVFSVSHIVLQKISLSMKNAINLDTKELLEFPYKLHQK